MWRTLYTGPMFAGKTTALIEHANLSIRNIIYDNKDILFLRPNRDTRSDKIITHDRKYSVEAKYFESASELVSILKSESKSPRVIAIDEIQFVDFSDEQKLSSFLDASIHNSLTELIVAGLNSDHFGNPYKIINAIWINAMKFDDQRSKFRFVQLHTDCHNCGQQAHLTQWVSPEPYGPDTRVGGSDKYEARCADCFEGYDVTSRATV